MISNSHFHISLKSATADVPVYASSLSTSSSKLYVGIKKKIVILNSKNGSIISKIPTIHPTINSISLRPVSTSSASIQEDDRYYATCGTDNNVILWKSEGPVTKYRHSSPISIVKFSPDGTRLVSGAKVDIGILDMHHMDEVVKKKVPSKVLCIEWSFDGEFFAVGHESGIVSIRDIEGLEKTKIQRPGPVFALLFVKTDGLVRLIVAGWDGYLCIYALDGTLISQTPICVPGLLPLVLKHDKYHGTLMIAGTKGNTIAMHTLDGKALCSSVLKGIEEGAWIWTMQVKVIEEGVRVFTTTDRSSISSHTLLSPLLSSTFKNNTIVRCGLSELYLLSNGLGGSCDVGSLIKHVNVCDRHVTVLTNENISLYEIVPNSSGKIDFRELAKSALKEYFQDPSACSHVGVCDDSVFVAAGNNLHLFTLSLHMSPSVWRFMSPIVGIRAIHGSSSNMCVYCATKSGEIFSCSDSLPSLFVKHPHSPTHMHSSVYNTHLSVCDGTHSCSVYSFENGEKEFSLSHVERAFFHNIIDDILITQCGYDVSVCVGGVTVLKQILKGTLIGVDGNKLIYIKSNNSKPLFSSLSFSTVVDHYIGLNKLKQAYKCACVGVSSVTWQILGKACLFSRAHISFATSIYVRMRDIHMIELTEIIKQIYSTKRSNTNELVAAEIFAYNGDYYKSALSFIKGGELVRASELLFFLEEEEEEDIVKKLKEVMSSQSLSTQSSTSSLTEGSATTVTSSATLLNLLQNHAAFLLSVGASVRASKVHINIGNIRTAMGILVDNGLYDNVFELADSLDPHSERQNIKEALNLLVQGRHVEQACKLCIKIGDIMRLVKLRVRERDWEEALKIATAEEKEGDKNITKYVYLSYGSFLAIQDEYEAAKVWFDRAGECQRSHDVLKQLCRTVVEEGRFEQAAKHFNSMALLSLKQSQMSLDQLFPGAGAKHFARSSLLSAFDLSVLGCYSEKQRKEAAILRVKSDLYSAYNHIHTPSHLNILECCLFIIRLCSSTMSPISLPESMSLFEVLFGVCTAGIERGVKGIAKQALKKLRHVSVPEKYRGTIELMLCSLTLSSSSDEDICLCPVCNSKLAFYIDGRRASSSGYLGLTSGRSGEVPDPSSFVNSSFPFSHDQCSVCGHNIVRSAVSFSPLPLCEIQPPRSLLMNKEKLLHMLQAAPAIAITGPSASSEFGTGASDRLRREKTFAASDDDQFQGVHEDVVTLIERSMERRDSVVAVSEENVLQMRPCDVFAYSTVKDGEITLSFFHKTDTSVPITQCMECGRLFTQEEYDSVVACTGVCPVCKSENVEV
ncbi:Intraflagellar transport protein 122 homolog like protein [Aduncisulcus paluster]|uniref:Intraflagellar transport protein 122 homolog n=1 Tax=Aduncisulcus paluster TaxID=2918883 RepID=A0ABQ5KQ91_9EUKA|nr:Intraflagellar transport protein 122 homolog like protein [Aduncisulcus paluster]